MHTLFNVLGLSMGVGVCITIFLMVYAGLNMDRFHPDAPARRNGSIRNLSPYRTFALKLSYEPFHLRFQDQVFEEDVKENENIKDMFLYLAAMTMIIAATGLFALVSVNIVRRTKEIGIRKVLGASAMQIMQLVNREFYVLIAVSAVLIFPVAYILLDGLLNSVFATHVGLSVWPFVGAVAAMALLSVITIGSRVIKVSVENPVHSLRYE
jgi:ABC-type antimicrobial peptide transport system permease subunit